jgi:hypothetical protein
MRVTDDMTRQLERIMAKATYFDRSYTEDLARIWTEFSQITAIIDKTFTF